tara:strand:+ start:3598 stop:3888 length:291 start_codon:yes stop_codon:yes gene_type:complete
MTRDLEKIKKIAKLITKQIGGSPVEDQEMLPEYGIQGSGILYCYEYNTKLHVKVSRGQKVWLIDSARDFLNRVLIYTNCGRIVEIDFDELICTEAD